MGWEVQLDGYWKPVGSEEEQFLNQLDAKGEKQGSLSLRGQEYRFDISAGTQTNVKSGKVRQIRPSPSSAGRAVKAALEARKHGGDITVKVNYRMDTGDRQSELEPAKQGKVMGIPVKMIDAREVEKKVTMKDNGFDLVTQPTGMSRKDFFDDALIVKKYYPLCEDAIKKAVGSSFVKCFHHLVRGHCTGQPFAGIAHADYSTHTAHDLVQRVVPEGIKMPFKGRMCVMNLWRNINPESPLKNHFLAMCDGASIVSPDDFVHYTSKDAATGKENLTFHMSPNNHRLHKWYYYPLMTADEVLVFMQFDSDPLSRCRYTFHSSVSVQDDTLDYKRESIEVRCVAFFPDEENNTMPDFTLPTEMLIPGAITSIKEMATYLPHWPEQGKSWAIGCITSDDFNQYVYGQCHHHRREAQRAEFKDLTDADIQKVAAKLVSDEEWKKEMRKLAKQLAGKK
eukprot:TRINITY_DN112446_c0_g1_i1.p1 TRINITY_DN112446_c0_g1~~TRINITY_DN112446_c0_g1_i1.p1  ORF type:complete len:488 (-),score=84.15 TRINITY_DN112446_c0_g1_i1:472-1830(-)